MLNLGRCFKTFFLFLSLVAIFFCEQNHLGNSGRISWQVVFFAHFDDQYWVMFPMAKGRVFLISRRKFPIQETKKISTFCDI